MRGTEDDYYRTERTSSANRVYVEDPYRGTVVLERDPYTGRYYEVGSYGNVYSNGNVYGNSRYDRRYNSNTYGRNNRNYRNNNVYQQAPKQVTPEQQRENDRNKGEARKKMLGN